MTDNGPARIRAAFAAAESVDPMDDTGASPPGDLPPGRPPEAPEPCDLPPSFPVVPLGHADGTFHFLTGRGEMMSLSAAALCQRSHLVALFSGAPASSEWLMRIGPPGPRDIGFSALKASDFLVQACAALPLFDGNIRIRRRGTWRGPGGEPVAHLGDRLLMNGETIAPGCTFGAAVYPAAPAAPAPVAEACDVGDLLSIRDAIAAKWNWETPQDADLLMGFIGQAVLGQFPEWRAHLWLQGRSGAGKSTLIGLISALLGGMSAGVRDEATAAAVRQADRDQAVVHIFDEAEATGEIGNVEKLVALFRLTSGADGARIERGSSGGTTTCFWLYGAALFGSINPGIMRPQDRSRFIMLRLGALPSVSDAVQSATELADLEEAAVYYGPHVWRRMLDQAPKRWDHAVRRYAALVHALGGDRRAAATIGAVLAGWDLLLHEEPLADVLARDGSEGGDRLERARALAQRLLSDVEESAAEDEGARCLRLLMAAAVPRDRGGQTQVAELIQELQGMAAPPSPTLEEARLLARAGLRVMPGDRGARGLFVANGALPILDRAFAGTPWRAGGHRSALLTLEGARPSPQTVRVGGVKNRGVILGAEHLPEVEDL